MKVGDIVKWGAWNENPEYGLVLKEPNELWDDERIFPPDQALIIFFNDCGEYLIDVTDLEVISESR